MSIIFRTKSEWIHSGILALRLGARARTGIALILGFLVRLASIPILAITLWVLAKASVFQGILASIFEGAGQPAALGGDLGIFFAVKDLAFVGAALLLLFHGAGKLSMDHYIDVKLVRCKVIPST